MPVETATEKAFRLLREHRLNVQRVESHDGLVVAEMQGDHATYMLGWDPGRKQWRCTCPEMKGQCSHLIALRAVVRR